MSKDFERLYQSVLEGERELKDSMNQATQKIQAVKFCDTFASDFERAQDIEQVRNQAPLDMIAELEKINARLDKQQSDSSKDALASRRREWLTIAIALLTLLATVLIGILK